MKITSLIFSTLAALLLAGCTGSMSTLQSVPASAVTTSEILPPVPIDQLQVSLPLRPPISAFMLVWTPSGATNVAYYAIQQTTNILSRTFFDLTNVIGTSRNVVVLATNQSGTWRIRAVNTYGASSTWTYLSL